MASFGIDPADFQTVTTVLDKLDKRTAAEIKQELTERMIKPSAVELIFKTIEEVTELIKSDPANSTAHMIGYFESKGLKTIGLINEVIQLNISARIRFDPWIIRGMDYYTGLIFEAANNKLNSSIGGGGVYNKLLPDGMEAVGMSIGVDRLTAVIQTIAAESTAPASDAPKYNMYVGSVGQGMEAHRFKLAQLLRSGGYTVLMPNTAAPSMRRQLQTVFDLGISLMFIIGPDEVAKGQVKLKFIAEKREITINYEDILCSFLEKS